MHSTIKHPTQRQEYVLGQLLSLRRSLSRGEVGPEWVVASTCTTLEAACSKLLDDRLSGRIEQGALPFEVALIKSQRGEMHKNWVCRLDWLSKGFGVTLPPALESDLLAMIELRNAIAHDGHSFTSRQIADYPRFLRLRQTLETSFKVHVRGTDFTISSATADASLRVGRSVAVELLA